MQGDVKKERMNSLHPLLFRRLTSGKVLRSAERPPPFAGADVETSLEALAKRHRRLEAAQLGNSLNTDIGCLKKFLTALQALGIDPLTDGHPCCIQEMAGKRSAAHVHESCQRVQVVRFLKVAPDIFKQCVDFLITGVSRYRMLNKLRLAALTIGRNHHSACGVVSNAAAVVFPHDIQTAVNARSGTGGSDEALVRGVQGIIVQMHERKTLSKILLKLPVGCRPTVVKQPGVGQYVCPKTQSHHFGAARPRIPQFCEEALIGLFFRMRPVREDYDVSGAQRLHPMRDINGKAHVGTDLAGGVGADAE